MDDWRDKAVLAMVPVVIAGSGWILSLESRVQVIDARQQERTARFEHVEKSIAQLNEEVMDPKPKPETRVAMDAMQNDIGRLKDDITRIHERINNLHSYLLQIPGLNPPFKPQKDGRRGDLFELYPQRQP